MNYVDKINEVIETIPVGSATFTINVTKRNLRVSSDNWTPKVEGDDFYSVGIEFGLISEEDQKWIGEYVKAKLGKDK